jgi:sugar phosphate isomerase/epimerase
MRKRLPFAVNHYLCPPSMGVQAFVEQLVVHGFSAVGLTQAALLERPATALREDLRTRGLRVSSVNTAGFFLQAGEDGAVQAARNAALLRIAAGLEGAALNVIVGGSATLPLPQARELAAERLAVFAREAADLGVQLLVEPLHFLNVRGKSCLNTIAQVERLFDRIPGLALNADLFHLWWDPDLERLLRGDSVPIGLLQICDVALSESQPLPRRVPLGEGCVPWADHVRAVRRAFPQAPVELELFADQLPGRRLEDLLADSAAALGPLSEE